MRSDKIRKLSIDAMLAAMCAVLGYLAIDMGNIKITLESLPVLLGALLFGPVDGLAIGGIGTLIYQLLRYGISVTTPLWILPYALCGCIVGACAKKHGFRLSRTRLTVLVVLNELLITVLNTGVLYVDSKIYGYYSAVYIFGTLIPRLAVCVGKAVAFALLLPVLIGAVRRVLYGDENFHGESDEK